MESSRDSRGDEPQSHTQQGGQHIEKPAHSCPEGHNQVIQDPLAHFLAIPWTAKLLADPAAFDIAVVDRRLLPTGDKQFIRSVLNSPTTVRACVVFWMRMPTTPPAQGAPPISKSRALLQGGGPQNGEDPEKPFLLFNALVDLGEDLCGYRGVLHGGLTAVLLDETMCSVSDSLGCHSVTATMTTKFRKPVKVPGVVVVRARVFKKEGRQIYVRGSIEDGDDSLLAEGEAMLVDKSPGQDTKL